VLGRDEGGLDRAAVLRERADRALHQRQHRALAQCGAAAGDGRRHLDRRPRLPRPDDALGLDVLGRVAEDREHLVERPPLRRRVLRRHSDPVERDLRQGVRDAGDVPDVGERRPAPLAGPGVEHLDRAAVGAEMDVLPVERQVAGGVARGERVRGRGRAQCGLDDVARDADDGRRAVHGRAVRLPEVQRERRGEAHAGGLDDRQGGLVDAPDVRGRQYLEARAGDRAGVGPEGGDRRHRQTVAVSPAPTRRRTRATAPIASSL
jgi:hypothetical protein